MNVRRGGVAGLSRERDHLAAPDPLAFADEERAIVRVHRRERARVFEDHQVAVAAQPMARVGDHAVAGGVHRRAFGDREIDPFMAMAPARGPTVSSEMVETRGPSSSLDPAQPPIEIAASADSTSAPVRKTDGRTRPAPVLRRPIRSGR